MIALTPVGTSNTQNFIPSVTDMTLVNTNSNSTAKDDLLYIPDMAAGELASEFAMLDPSLAEFHGDLRAAAAELALARQSGQGLAQALSRFQTAESIYQTRLLEVRGNKLAMDIATANNAENDKAALYALAMQEKMDAQFAALRKRRIQQKRKREKEKEQQYSWFFYFAIGLWIAQMQQQRRNDFKQSMQSQMRMRFAEQA